MTDLPRDRFTYYLAFSPDTPLSAQLQQNLEKGFGQWLEQSHGPRDEVEHFEIHDRGLFVVFTVGGVTHSPMQFRDSALNVAKVATKKAAVSSDSETVCWQLRADSWMGSFSPNPTDDDFDILRELVTADDAQGADSPTENHAAFEG